MSQFYFEAELEEKLFGRHLRMIGQGEKRVLRNQVVETATWYAEEEFPGVRLKVECRQKPDSDFTRYRYTLYSDEAIHMTKKEGQDSIVYGKWNLVSEEAEEIQLSHFASMVHSFIPVNYVHRAEEPLEIVGPIVMARHGDGMFLAAYEHGAEAPDSYLIFVQEKTQEGQRIILKAHKGNYYHGQVIDKEHPWRSVWIEVAQKKGSREELLHAYRNFFLYEISENTETRKPYIYYNSWGLQERNASWYERPFLEKMTQECILKEIDAAHELGVDVFVIDTGWYGKTGDWEVSAERFPNRLKDIKAKLDGYGMKLGLWMNPVVAARTSQVCQNHPEYVLTKEGKEEWMPIWETEESTSMCLASGYSDFFIRKMLTLYETLGVTYFKWDAICQYGCDSACHEHGKESNSPKEREECYAYQMGMEMIRIVEAVTEVHPEIIVDFDVTEGKRFVGLGFLAAGKYFLANSSLYTEDLGIPEHRDDLKGRRTLYNYWKLTNVFLHPSAARNRFIRQNVRYDYLIPSVLFLTHYFPDGPKNLQDNSLAALCLGANGIWGNLQDLSREDKEYFAQGIRRYKRVADAVTKAYPVHVGELSASPEIIEKLDDATGEGVVCFFTCNAGTFRHRTAALPAPDSLTVWGADDFRILSGGNLELTVELPKDGARMIVICRK